MAEGEPPWPARPGAALSACTAFDGRTAFDGPAADAAPLAAAAEASMEDSGGNAGFFVGAVRFGAACCAGAGTPVSSWPRERTPTCRWRPLGCAANAVGRSAGGCSAGAAAARVGESLCRLDGEELAEARMVRASPGRGSRGGHFQRTTKRGLPADDLVAGGEAACQQSELAPCS